MAAPRSLTPLKWIGGTAAGAAALAAALAFQPAAAQTATPTPATTQQTPAPAESFLNRVAGKLGVTPERLRTAIVDAAKDAINARVASGALTREQADRLILRLEQRGPGLLERLGDWRRRAEAKARRQALAPMRAVVEVVASTSGQTADQVREQLRAGKSLAEIGAAAGKTQAQLRDAVLAAARQRADQAVADGTLTRQQADRLLERLSSSVDRILTHKFERRRQ